MAAIVIDASIAAAWCFPDERTDFTEGVLDVVGSSDFVVVAPTLWAYEIRNTVLMGLRRGRITKPDSDRFLAAIAGINVLLNDPSSYESIFAFAEEHGLTFYDAAYLSLAKEQHLPLATLDKQLPKAADPAGVQLFHP
jgi:predicted nucleic acid-binding protein